MRNSAFYLRLQRNTSKKGVEKIHSLLQAYILVKA